MVTNASANLTVQSFSHGQITVQVQGVPTFTYEIQAATNLLDTNWVPVTTNTSPFTFTDPVSAPQRFYRAIYLP